MLSYSVDVSSVEVFLTVLSVSPLYPKKLLVLLQLLFDILFVYIFVYLSCHIYLYVYFWHHCDMAIRY